jgi:hypothetical protein
MNPCRCRCSAADSPSMPLAAAPSSLDDHPPAPIASRRPWPSGRKNAYRGLTACRRPPSGKSCSQALIASGKNRRSPTTARRSHLLQQSGASQSTYPMVDSPVSEVDVNGVRPLGQLDISFPGISAWTLLGNIANGALYLALLHSNPLLAGRLRPERPVPGGGRINELLDNNFAYELKPASWQVGDNYAAALLQLNGYLIAGGYSAGSWSRLTSAATVGVGGWFTGYGMSGNLTFMFYPDPTNQSSGLIFYEVYGTYRITPGVGRSTSGLTFYP